MNVICGDENESEFVCGPKKIAFNDVRSRATSAILLKFSLLLQIYHNKDVDKS